MAKARQKPSGMWEIGVRHPSLPGGRKYFTFDSEEQANGFGEQWKTMKMAGLQPPAALLQPTSANHSLGLVLRQWSNSGLAAPSQYVTLGSLISEVGAVKLVDADYGWLAAYVQRLKVENNLAPNSIRHRVQALGRAIDEFARHNPKLVIQNPVRLLPKGYSTYTDVDQKLVAEAGGDTKEDVARDRRLHRGEEPRIIEALSGKQRDDRERGLLLPGGNALLTMFILIVYSGLRLREAYTLRRQQIDLDAKVMRVQSSKQWRGRVVFREVPMRQEVHAALTHYLSTRAMLPAAMLFPFTEEEPDMTLTKVSQRLSARFRSAFEYAGCMDLREHDLRHEATCRWLELRDASGNWMFRLEEVNRIMGWSANSTMAQRYASFRGSDLADRMWASAGPASAAPAASGGAA
jgi:integrase